MDSRMIDVAIGLVLVFALSGLAVTTLHEIWSNVRKTRGRNLEDAIFSMLGDREGQFARSVLAHPLIDSLTDAPLIGSGKPSYIGADALVSALMSKLTDLYCNGVRPDTPSAFVAALRLPQAIKDAPSPPAGLVTSLGTLAVGAESDWNTYLKRVCAWYDAVGDRSIGWFKRDTQMRLFLIGLVLAAVVNINPFVIAPRLWNDEVLRKATVQAAERAAAAYGAASAPDSELLRRVAAALVPPPDAKSPAAVAPAGANAPIQAEVDSSLATLDRLLRAQMKTQNASGSIALLSQLSAGLDQLTQIEHFVAIRRTAALAGQRQAVTDASESIRRRIEQFGQPAGEKKSVEPPFPALGGAAKKEVVARIAELKTAAEDERKRLLPETKRKAARVCAPNITDAQRKLCEDLDGLSDAVARSGLPVGWQVSNLPDCDNGPCVVATRSQARGDKASPSDNDPPDSAWLTAQVCLKDMSCAGISVLGWLLTALAAMLGAPFWFDLLGKLIKLRGAGAKPEGDPAKPGAPGGSGAAPGGMLTTPQPVAGAAGDGAGAASTMRDVQTRAEAALPQAKVMLLQGGELGRFGARPSGFFDEDTRKAIMAWQASVGHGTTGELTQAEIDLLLGGVTPSGPTPGTAVAADDAHVDGCDCQVTVAMPDENLPLAHGGTS